MTKPTIDERIEVLRAEPYDASEHDVEVLIATNDKLLMIIRDLQKSFLAACDDQDIEVPAKRIAKQEAENAELKEENARLKAEIDDLDLYINHRWGGQHVNEPGVGPMARLKQENRDLEAENERLKDKLSYWQDPNWTSPGVGEASE